VVFAPIVLFVYNRPEHARKTVVALQNNILASYSELFIYSDGAKNDHAKAKVDEIREYIKTINGFKQVTIFNREKNFGLATNIIDGVTKTVNEYGKVIVLEDDMITSPYFLQFMNDALDVYEEVENVACIHGYLYPLNTILSETFFIKGADCWGWAAWKRSWDLFEMDGKKLLKKIMEQKKQHEFNFDGTYNFLRMLKGQISGRNDSWAVRWYASAFLANKLTLYPGISLVNNIGNDASGTHCGESNVFEVIIADRRIDVIKIDIVENKLARSSFVSFYKENLSFRKRLIRWLKRLLNIWDHAVYSG